MKHTKLIDTFTMHHAMLSTTDLYYRIVKSWPTCAALTPFQDHLSNINLSDANYFLCLPIKRDFPKHHLQQYTVWPVSRLTVCTTASVGGHVPHKPCFTSRLHWIMTRLGITYIECIIQERSSETGQLEDFITYLTRYFHWYLFNILPQQKQAAQYN